MRKIVWTLSIVFLLSTASQGFADSVTLYNALPNPQPPNLPSLGYEATSTRQFGELIQLALSGNFDVNATILMSNWALESQYETVGTSLGYSHDLTLNLYGVGASNTVGSLIASDTITAFIPWRPEADPTCPGGTAYRAGNGSCYNGSLSEANFTFAAVNLPSQIIYGLSYNTADYGNAPIGTPGPYNSLNFALNTAPPSVGSNPLPDTAYWDTSYGPFYTDGGAGGVGVFRQDTGWDPYNGAAKFEGTSVPEPSVLLLMGIGLLLFTGDHARRRFVRQSAS